MKEEKTPYNSAITKDDLQALGDKQGNLRKDNGDDTILKERKNKIDFAGDDLDVPSSIKAKNQTKDNLKDEENKIYSLGSDDNENLEIDTLNKSDKQQ